MPSPSPSLPFSLPHALPSSPLSLPLPITALLITPCLPFIPSLPPFPLPYHCSSHHPMSSLPPSLPPSLTCHSVVCSCKRGECIHIPEEDGLIQATTGHIFSLLGIRKTSSDGGGREINYDILWYCVAN